ncbi:hypothetical protein GCM10020331_074420 [Ectobacillus funiculus]
MIFLSFKSSDTPQRRKTQYLWLRRMLASFQKANGGEGAVRELIDHILTEGYDYKSLLHSYFNGTITFTQ